MQSLDLVPLQASRRAFARRRPESTHEDDDRFLVRATPTLPLDGVDNKQVFEFAAGDLDAVDQGRSGAVSGKVAFGVVVVHSPRAPNGVVRRSGRFPFPRLEVTIDSPDPTLVFINYAQFPHAGRPHFAIPHVLDFEPDPVQRREEAREAGKDGSDREEGRDVGQRTRRGRCRSEVGVEISVPTLDDAHVFLSSPATRSRLGEMGGLGAPKDLEVLLRPRAVMALESGEEPSDGFRRLSHLVLEGDVGPTLSADQASEARSSREEFVERLDVRGGGGIRCDKEGAADRSGGMMPREDAAFVARRVDPDLGLR